MGKLLDWLFAWLENRRQAAVLRRIYNVKHIRIHTEGAMRSYSQEYLDGKPKQDTYQIGPGHFMPHRDTREPLWFPSTSPGRTPPPSSGKEN